MLAVDAVEYCAGGRDKICFIDGPAGDAVSSTAACVVHAYYILLVVRHEGMSAAQRANHDSTPVATAVVPLASPTPAGVPGGPAGTRPPPCYGENTQKKNRIRSKNLEFTPKNNKFIQKAREFTPL